MMAQTIGREAQQAITLIKSFSLELKDYSAESQVLHWLNQYKAAWIRDAVIEAIYLGRYKIISVQHILSIWQKRGQPVRHFTSGFEQVMASHLGEPIHLPTDLASRPNKAILSNGSHPLKGSTTSLTMLYRAGHLEKDLAQGSFSNSNHNHDATRLAIEPFPVNDVNTLVEVYQANISASKLAPRQKTAMQSSGSNSLSFELLKPTVKPLAPLQQSKVHAPLVGSRPIQPFRPN